jgi:hypothetical protein
VQFAAFYDLLDVGVGALVNLIMERRHNVFPWCIEHRDPMGFPVRRLGIDAHGLAGDLHGAVIAAEAVQRIRSSSSGTPRRCS